MTNPDWAVDNLNCSILDSIIVNCGNLDPSKEPAFMRHTDNLNMQGRIENNQIYLINPLQKLNYLGHKNPPLTNEFPENYMISNNSIIIHPNYFIQLRVILTGILLGSSICCIGIIYRIFIIRKKEN
jgi:hypothetical protein